MNILFIFIGFVTLILGVLGIVLPILPATPFLIIALYCFTKGSYKLTVWLQKTTIYKKYIKKYIKTKSLSLIHKILIQILANGMMISAFMFLNNLFLKIVLVICFIIHNWVIIFKVKTRTTNINKYKEN